MRTRSNLIVMLTLSILLMTAEWAYGVIPSLLGPLQGLISILPQILIFIAAGFTTIFSVKKWRMWLLKPIARIIFVSVIVIVVGGGVTLLVLQSKFPANRSGTASATDRQGDVSSNAWIAFRGGWKRTGSVGSKAGPEKGEEIWAFKDPEFRAGDFSSSPAVVGGRVYVGSAQASVFSSCGFVYCLDATTGEMIWKFRTPREIFSSPAVVNGKVYIGEGLHRDVDAQLYCLNADTGELIWSFQTTSHVESSPTVVDGKVLFGGGEDGVYCLDAETGRQIWRYPGINVSLSPAVYGDNVYVGSGYGDMNVYCLDLNTGKEKWKKQLDYPVWGSPCIGDGKIYFGSGNGNFVESDENPHGKVVCIDMETSEIVWEYDVDDAVLTAIALNDGEVYFGSRDGHLYCLDADSGKLKWKWLTEEPILSSPAVTNKHVYFGSNDGVLYCLKRSDGELKWKFDTTIVSGGAKILSSPAVVDNKVYVGSSKQYFFCIGEKET